ncbi:MAG TPA: hypothetical protein VFB22_17595 [Candidatus Baltobacteraceae bacterium]|nr:hypothetical protein [Candidatus Baltobacteraceae bacterium]
MRSGRRDRLTGIALVAALAGSFAVAAAALARAGVCICAFRLTWHGVQIAGDPDRSGALAAGVAPLCPVLVWAAAAAGGLYLLALVCLLALRASPREMAVASARLVLRCGLVPRAALIAAAAAPPVGALVLSDGLPDAALLALAAGFVVLLSLFGAVAAALAARIVVAFARRFVVALVRALRLLLAPPHAPRLVLLSEAPAACGVALARRRPSRAPPVWVALALA